MGCPPTLPEALELQSDSWRLHASGASGGTTTGEYWVSATGSRIRLDNVILVLNDLNRGSRTVDKQPCFQRSQNTRIIRLSPPPLPDIVAANVASRNHEYETL